MRSRPRSKEGVFTQPLSRTFDGTERELCTHLRESANAEKGGERSNLEMGGVGLLDRGEPKADDFTVSQRGMTGWVCALKGWGKISVC